MPTLRSDLFYAELFPPGVISSVQSWVGPSGARTGLHHDYPDNLAVQIVGKKRFHLVRPGVVERMGAVSKKYDAWAVLATASAQELATRMGNTSQKRPDFFTVDLAPGDVLYVPAGWWHEVFNLSACVSFGGFYGGVLRGAAVQTWVGARELAHRLGWLGREACTCHAPQQHGEISCPQSTGLFSPKQRAAVASVAAGALDRYRQNVALRFNTSAVFPRNLLLLAAAPGT